MKKIFLTSGILFCFGAGVFAQEPAKAAAKKATPALKTTLSPQTETKEEAEARLKAKLKHYEALKAGAAQSTPIDARVDASKAARKPGVN
jgi:hypothetical protein